MKRLSAIIPLVLGLAGALVAQPGLDSPQAIGPYLGGVFPTTTPGPTGGWAVADAIPGMTFVDPVRMVKDPLGPDHVYIVCRSGEVWRIPFSPTATNAQKVRVLDRRANTWGFWDAGMMSIAFHPEFGVPGSPNRGFVYVFYQFIPTGHSPSSVSSRSYMRLSRFNVPDGQVVFDPASEFVMINQFDRHNWHNGGQMFFGPDRFLYLVIGDEGDANDSFNVGQKINERLFGGVLRIDVDNDPARSHPIRRQPLQITMPAGWGPSFTQGYSIPKDNPWLDPNGGILEEFWCIGTRSPHSMHYDAESAAIWIADVGQGTREEISIASRGGNLQWPYREGNAGGPKAKPANLIGTDIAPVFDYGRSMGGCVIGGIVYRGTTHAGALTGKYIFGDHNTRAIYMLDRQPGQPTQVTYLTAVNRSGGTKSGLAGICEGPDGEVYFLELGNTGADTGKILKLVRTGTPVPDPPPLLSQTGAFTNLATLSPRAGLIPYDVNSPLWSDGAEKLRWIAIPNDGSHNTAAERVTFRAKGAWDFPAGTVLVKHFAMPVDERNPALLAPIETRFFVHGSDGVYYGVTYRWNAGGTDAFLINAAESRDFTITAADGSTRTQRWDFPGRPDCRTCHTLAADNVLGLRAHQMHRDVSYPLTGRSAGQLETWNHLGIFGSSFSGIDPTLLDPAADPLDPHAALDHRVRSYIDVNCSHCHHPTGVSANFDARYETPLDRQGLIGGLINRPINGSQDRVVVPGDPVLSLLHARANTVGANQMPPLGKNVVDQRAMAVVADWIASLDPAGLPPSTGQGLVGDYYSGRNFESFAFSRADSPIDFDWGTGSPGGGLPADLFSIRWKGSLTPPATGTYTFFTTTDDGVRLRINGSTLIDRWVDQAPTEHSATVNLVQGQAVDLEMEYFETSGGAMARLSWSGPGIAKSVVPTSAFEFAGSPPVAVADAFICTHAGETRLNVLANDSAPNGPPGIHGVAIISPPAHGSIRISGAEKRLVYTHDGSPARADSFTYQLTDPSGLKSGIVAVDLDIPFDFAAWQASTPGAGGGPLANPDGDLLPDLLEFALGGNPADGGSPGAVAFSLVEEAGGISFKVIRPAGLSGIRYRVQAGVDLAAWNWVDDPQLSSLPDGREMLTFPSLHALPGLSADGGFARLVVELNGTGQSAGTLPLGWLAAEIGAASRTVGMPFRNPPVFSSAVISSTAGWLAVNGNPALPPGTKGFVEVQSGVHAGHRFDVASVAAGGIQLESGGTSTPGFLPDLAGAEIVLCTHHTIGGLFPKERFKGSTNPANADQLQFYRNEGGQGRFELYYLLDARPANPAHQWRAFLPGGGDQAGRVIAPGEGVLVKRPPGAPAARLLLSGQVRANRFAMPLRSGIQLAGPGFPLPMTPRQRGMLDPLSGFFASTNIAAADQFQLYQNNSFRIFYLLNHPTLSGQWRETVPGSPGYNDQSVFQPTEAAFIKRRDPSPAHFIAPPWNP